MANNERRRYPRIQGEGVALTLGTGTYDTVAHTMDISASGVYCKLDHEIPLMSRVNIVLVIPDQTGSGKRRTINAGGVVVREHPVIIDGKVKHYDAAIFFEELADKDRTAIERYIARKQG